MSKQLSNPAMRHEDITKRINRWLKERPSDTVKKSFDINSFEDRTNDGLELVISSDPDWRGPRAQQSRRMVGQVRVCERQKTSRHFVWRAEKAGPEHLHETHCVTYAPSQAALCPERGDAVHTQADLPTKHLDETTERHLKRLDMETRGVD